MKYLIIGSNGLVGKNLTFELFENNIPFTATFNKTTTNEHFLKCDILIKSDIENVFEIAKPDVVINATNLAGGVDFCENNPDIAKSFQYESNKIIGNFCLKYNSKYVLISTDYVFDGLNPPYSENDKVNPLNIYGSYKLLAEQWITENIQNSLIIRTTNVFGWDPLTTTPNFLMNLFFKLSEAKTINVPSFLYGNPTYANDLAKAIIELCTKNANGIFNIVGSSFINRYDWAVKFCKIMGFDEKLLIKSENPPQNMIPRPLLSNLSTQKFIKTYNTKLHNVDESLELFYKESKLAR